jgi:hypothetical protein
MSRTLISKIITVPLSLILIGNASAQQVPALDKKSISIRRKADSLAPQARISIIYKRSGESYGKFLSDDAESFTYYDIDSQTNVTAHYADVKKLKDGYGGRNSVTGRHTDRTKGLLIGGAVAAILIIVVIAAAKS